MKRIECTHSLDCNIRAEIAQLVEHSAVNRGVIGSSPILLAIHSYVKVSLEIPCLYFHKKIKRQKVSRCDRGCAKQRSTCYRGEIGKHKRLKISRRNPCPFKSGR